MLIGAAAAVGGVVIIGFLFFLNSSPPLISGSPPIQPAELANAQPQAVAAFPTPAAPQGNPTSLAPTSVQVGKTGSSPSGAADSATVTADDSKEKPVGPRVKLDMEELIKKIKPSVVRIATSSPRGPGIGSGFVVDTKGTVVTNVHVLAGATKADVEFSNGTKTPIVGIYSHDPKRDIAIVKIDLPADQLTPIPLATELPAQGAAVVAFGAPIGLSFTASEGIVSAHRPAEEMNQTFGVEYQGDWIQTSTPISPGNSGGPLVNHYGEVVAMNTMQLTVGQNLNFAMSAVDIGQAVAKAPAEYKAFTADVIKAAPVRQSRAMASDETETERGRRLLAQVTEIFLLNATSRKTLAYDRTGLIWGKVISKSRGSVEKSKIELSVDEPSDDAAIMFVILEMKTSKKKTVTMGTQELHITAELVCKDESGKKDESKICRIWKGEENLGTISITSLGSGTFPSTAEENLSKFFRKFKSAVIKARQSQTDDDPKDDKKDGKSSPKTSQSNKDDGTKSETSSSKSSQASRSDKIEAFDFLKSESANWVQRPDSLDCGPNFHKVAFKQGFEVTKSWVLAFDFNTPDLNSGPHIMIQCGDDEAGHDLFFVRYDGEKLFFALGNTQTDKMKQIVAPLGSKQIGVWVRLIFCYDAESQEMKLFLDDRLVVKDTALPPVMHRPMPVLFGGSGPSSQRFTGELRNIWLGNMPTKDAS